MVNDETEVSNVYVYVVKNICCINKLPKEKSYMNCRTFCNTYTPHSQKQSSWNNQVSQKHDDCDDHDHADG